jgi:hypothetical protein
MALAKVTSADQALVVVVWTAGQGLGKVGQHGCRILDTSPVGVGSRSRCPAVIRAWIVLV